MSVIARLIGPAERVEVSMVNPASARSGTIITSKDEASYSA